jgi:hypothetical protein
MPKYFTCPHCGEPWSVVEVQEQECFACGWPRPVDEEDDGIEDSDTTTPLGLIKGENMPQTDGYNGGFDTFFGRKKI